MSETENSVETKILEKNEKVINHEEFNSQNDSMQIRVYKRRWLMLLLFTSFTLGNKTQWIQYTIILNVVTKYFGVSTLAIKSTAMVYNISFLILLYPVSWMIHRWGIKRTCVIASASTCLGTWIKYLSISPSGFVPMLVGQAMIGTCQIVILSMPSTLAAQWFGPSEIATATAIGYAGMTFGIAIFSLITPLVVKIHENLDDIGSDLSRLSLPIAFYCTAVFLLILVFFREKPKLPPSKAKALQILRRTDEFEFWKAISRLVKIRNFILLWNAHGFIVGQLIAVSTSLNALYIMHFENGEEDVGKIGLVFTLSGFLGSLVFGRVLDKTKKFKTILTYLCVACALSSLCLEISFYVQIRWMVFVSAGLYGFFVHGFFSNSFENCAELTYPESESFCAVLLNLANQFYAAIFIICSDKLILAYNDVAAYILFTVISVCGCILTFLITDDRRRENAGNSVNNPLM